MKGERPDIENGERERMEDLRLFFKVLLRGWACSLVVECLPSMHEP
jgi:hypothetical protein